MVENQVNLSLILTQIHAFYDVLFIKTAVCIQIPYVSNVEDFNKVMC